ncbi:MAG: 6-phosphogluconolactonase [Anaerolineae bacterium]|nr:6-phosphogluconolactonase [Anaerolineae bacterium]
MDNLEIVPDVEALAHAGAERFVALGKQAIRTHGRFSVVLSGGSTPRRLYSLLASAIFAGHIDWEHIFVFWGDERCVPPNHPDSNYRMAREALLDHVSLPAGNEYRMRGEIDPAQAAAEYEHALRIFGGGNIPRFDLILLGLGDDGHTASLFPDTAALTESRRWVVENYVDRLDVWRLTLTLPVINAAANVLFLVAGEGKAEIMRTVLRGPRDVYPAQFIRPTDGHVGWLVDAAASRLL